MSVARFVVTLMAMAVSSFLFGFFVVARLWPTAPKTESVASDPDLPDPTAAVRHASAAATQTPAPAPGAPNSTAAPATHAPLPTVDPITPLDRAIETGQLGANAPVTAGSPSNPDPSALTGSGGVPGGPASGLRNGPGAGQRDAGSGSADRQTDAAPGATADRAAHPDDRIAEDSPAPGQRKYRVQLGIFRDLSDAQDRVREAQDKGFEAKVVQFTSTNGGVRYRVQAGEYQDRDHADDLRRDLANEGIKSRVIDH
jgi:hypothetical protein